MGDSRQLDDPYHRIQKQGSYKDQRFDGKRTIKDDYDPHKKIYYGNSADAKHRHPIEKCSDIDHVVPLNKIGEKYGDLTKEQQRSIANKSYNYAVTSSHLNRQKGDKDNHEYLLAESKKILDNCKKQEWDSAKKGAGELFNKAPSMLGKEVTSKARMSVDANVYRVKNSLDKVADVCPDSIEQSMIECIQAGNQTMFESGIPIMSCTVANMIAVSQNEMDVEDAVSNTALKAGELWMQGAVKKKAGNAIQNCNNAFVLEINDILKIPEVSTAVKIVGDSFIRMVNGEISESDFAEDVVSKVISSQLKGVFVQLSGYLVIPVPVVGQLIGSVIISTICDKLQSACKSVMEIKKSLSHISDKAHEISSLAVEAKKEIERQRREFNTYTEKYNSEIQLKAAEAFQMIHEGIMADSYEKTSDGLEIMANMVNTTTSDISMQWLLDSWKGRE